MSPPFLRPAGALAHEAVELLLVAGAAQIVHVALELATLLVELAALFLEPLQFLLAIVVEGDIAARRSSRSRADRGPQPRNPRHSRSTSRRPVK